MTEQTARDLLTYLVTTFLNNGFSDVGTFLLPEYGTQSQYDRVNNDYQYRDSSSALQDLLADRNARPKETLRRLLRAAQQYFDRAYTIPKAYATAISAFEFPNQSAIDTRIQLLGQNQETVTNLTEILQSRQVQQMQRLLGILAERIEEENDSFLNDLEGL